MVSAPKPSPSFLSSPEPARTLTLVEPAAHGAAHAPSMSVATRGRLRALLTALHGVAGVAAVIGGGLLVAQPSGAALGLDPAQLSGFTSFLVPGFLLLALGIAQLAAAALARKPGATPMSVSHWAGASLVLFVAFQSALVQPILVVSAAMLVVGTLIYAVSHELHHDEPHTPLLP